MSFRNFVGIEMPECTALRRPLRAHRVQRSQQVAVPAAWGVLFHELLRCTRAQAWDGWQALSSCPWSDAQALRSALVVWAIVPETLTDYGQRAVTPARLMALLEMLVIAGRLRPREASILEEAVLRQTALDGTWKHKRI